jgi:hypothetical protein
MGSRRTPVAASIRRSDQPSRPSPITYCCLVSSKTLLMAVIPHRGPTAVSASAPASWWPVFRCPRLAGFGCPLRGVTNLAVARRLAAQGVPHEAGDYMIPEAHFIARHRGAYLVSNMVAHDESATADHCRTFRSSFA